VYGLYCTDLIPMVKMETRNPVEVILVVNFWRSVIVADFWWSEVIIH